jgi:hypothetical protein
MDPRVKPAGDASKLDTGKRGGVIPAPVILNPVIAGLDPAIHPLQMKRFFPMDARVKPAHDGACRMRDDANSAAPNDLMLWSPRSGRLEA